MDFVEHGGDRGGAGTSASARRARPDFDWTGTWSGSASPTRPRCWPANRSPWRARSARRVARRHGAEAAAERVRSFDTICSATQERQDAVVQAAREAARPDARGGRIQLEQHDAPGRARRIARGPDLSHRGRERDRPRSRDRSGTSRCGRSATWSMVPAGWARPGSSASPPAPRRRTTRSARRSRGSRPRPASRSTPCFGEFSVLTKPSIRTVRSSRFPAG